MRFPSNTSDYLIQIDFDQLPAADRDEWQLPEGFDDRVIIIGSLDDNGRRSSFSNYGRSGSTTPSLDLPELHIWLTCHLALGVDYWVYGEKLAFAGYEKSDRVSGTSHGREICCAALFFN